LVIKMAIRKQAEIQVDSNVKYVTGFFPELPFTGKLSAKVISIDEEQSTAVISFDKIKADEPHRIKRVFLSSLENNTWERDGEATLADIKDKWLNAPEKIRSQDWTCGWVYEALTERYYEDIESYYDYYGNCKESEEAGFFTYLFAAFLEEPEPYSANDWAYSAYEDYFSEGHDDAELEGMDELEEAFEKFHKLNAPDLSYPVADFSKAIIP